jgi:cyclic peptide transporter
MKKETFLKMNIVLALTLVCLFPVHLPGYSGENTNGDMHTGLFTQIEEHTRELMEAGDIPGLSLVVITGDSPIYIKGFGFADKENKIPVTGETLFELGSCSKAFTALAAIQMENRGLINLDNAVSDYLPWFSMTYNGQPHKITIRQLLHHTSGIPWNALTRIPRGSEPNALEQTVRKLSDMELKHIPGKAYLYSTVNYDVVGAIIQKVSGMSFEEYMAENIFKPLDLFHTRVGVDKKNPPPGMAKGYKIGFFFPRHYDAPVYRGNNPAAYIISNAKDIARWLKFQMGTADTPFRPLIQKTQIPDLSVKPDPRALTSYAMGWTVNQYETGGIFHGGLNPNFTAYITFNPKNNKAVAVLANSNSSYTPSIGNTVMNLLENREVPLEYPVENNLDKSSSVISIMLGLFLLFLISFFIFMGFELIKGRRQYEALNWGKLGKIFMAPLLLFPFFLGVYIIPRVIAEVNWDTAFVWAPQSFKMAVVLSVIAVIASYIGYIISIIFPQKNKYLRSIPMILVLSLISGGANAMIIFLVTGSIYSNVKVIYLLYYFVLALVMYIVGRKIVQTRLLKVTVDIVYDLRMKLFSKIFYTSYQHFEQIEEGRVFATLNNDTDTIATSATVFVSILTNMITVLGVFIYLANIAFWATMVTLMVIMAIAILYMVVGRKAQQYLEQLRDMQNIYMDFLKGLVDGFKELCLHFKKKKEYNDDLENVNDKYRKVAVTALVKLINAGLVGESMLIIVLGAVGFGVPRLFTSINMITIMSFIIALLYLIGPINGILGSIPTILQIRVAWGRVQGFMKDIPANMKPEDVDRPLPVQKEAVQHLNAKGIMFIYKNQTPVTLPANPGNNDNGNKSPDKLSDEEKGFVVGPLDFEAKKGEIVFIVGGNGSGKTTLAKMLAGLYMLKQGSVKINGVEIPIHQLGEYFSMVFSNYHLFEKLYEVDMTKKESEAQKHLETLEIDQKVEIKDNKFSTINLSGGQRKRLALLQSYLEDSPICLFDEVAADQDPHFRRFFYRDLLLRMKAEGKIVIAITHDDHYFDVADRVIKMDMGKIDYQAKGSEFQYQLKSHTDKIQ